MLETYKQPFKIVVAGLGDFIRMDTDVVDGEQALAAELVKIEFQGSRVFSQLCLGFFEGDENARLGIHARAIDQEFDAEHSFTAPRTATNESRARVRGGVRQHRSFPSRRDCRTPKDPEPIFDVMGTGLFETGLFERKGAAVRRDVASECTSIDPGRAKAE